MPLFETITDLTRGAEILRWRAYGVIEMAEGRFRRVRLRPFPKIISAPEIVLFGQSFHNRAKGDRLWLYYNQPRRFPNFLTLKYVVSARQTSLGSLTRALDVLDYIARLKLSDALLCDAGNWRISTTLMARWGWIPHCASRWHRHYIKRFYGNYPPPARWIDERILQNRSIPAIDPHNTHSPSRCCLLGRFFLAFFGLPGFKYLDDYVGHKCENKENQ